MPKAMLVQLARLFGEMSAEASRRRLSTAGWRRTLKKILRELDRYLAANVETDEVHLLMLYSGLCAAHESLKAGSFWPGYVEGLTRFALALMGDYPDHRRRKGGRKPDDHYRLSRQRSIHYFQDSKQKLNTFLAAPELGIHLSKTAREALSEFRQLYGYSAGYSQFFKWYRKAYPADYSSVF